MTAITDSQRLSAVNYALSVVGKGTYELNAPLTGNAYDCSSLTLRAWLAAGVHIPRNSLDQGDVFLNNYVTLVPYTERNLLKRKVGDLVFYYTETGWTHVAMITGVDHESYILVTQASDPQRGIETIRMNAYNPPGTTAGAIGFMGHS
jgi:cell wall-associated NlpC family hydrolase